MLLSCSSRAPQQRPTGIAYAGPATLHLRKDLASKSSVVGTVSHSERLEVLETRRRFVKVRTAQGIEGWTDSNLLLTSQQMDDLHRLSESAAKLPSQGSAKVFDPVNMHTEPNRQSPSFFQIPEAGSVDVIGHRATPRVAPIAAAPRPSRRTPSKKAKTSESKSAGPAPPAPVPPAPPRNWVELSRPRAAELPGYAAPAPSAPATLEDWNLVRMRDGKTGWVLARMLFMSIPDEVAQYAEGHRISAYLPLGDVKDQNQIKHNWLWTTVSNGEHAYEFDSFRVFVWSVKRHHYETAYIERNVKGHYPVEIAAIPGQEAMGFSLVLEDNDAKPYTRTYAFSGYHVRMVSKTPYQSQAALPETHGSPGLEPAVPSPAASGGLRQKLREWRKRLTGK